MTVRKGEAWGTPAAVPADAVVVYTDREARAIVERALRAGAEVPPLGLAGGDLCRTLGGGGASGAPERLLGATEAAQFPLDIGVAEIDGQRHWFVAHLVARRSWWHGRVVAVMNAEWFGRWDVAPRAHPGDGLLDVVDADLRLGDRIEARRRLPAGSHVPHPDIAMSRRAQVELRFDRPVDIWLDSERVARARAVDVSVVSDAIVGFV